MAVLFLDFDGVTHPTGLSSESEKCFSQLPIIEHVLRAFPDISVVLSTTWRNSFPMEKCLHKFSPDIKARVVDKTPSQPSRHDLPVELFSYDRHLEVFHWLRMHRDPWDKWIALEDQPWRYQPFCPNVMLINPKTGFTVEDASKLTAHLAGMGEHHV